MRISTHESGGFDDTRMKKQLVVMIRRSTIVMKPTKTSEILRFDIEDLPDAQNVT